MIPPHRLRPAAQPGPPMGPLYAALAKAQGKFPDFPKNRQGHGYRYADLSSILRKVRPILAREGLAMIQTIDGESCTTTLAHESGAELAARYPLVIDGTGRMNSIQRTGAAVTYARRYGLSALLGIAADDDTDAHDKGGVDETPVGEEERGRTPDPWMANVLDALPSDASARDKAVAVSEQIMKDFKAYKSSKGLIGGWDKRARPIRSLEERHPDLFMSVDDCYFACLNALREAENA